MNKANARLIGFLSKAVLKINRENTDKIRLFCYLMTQKVISHMSSFLNFLHAIMHMFYDP